MSATIVSLTQVTLHPSAVVNVAGFIDTKRDQVLHRVLSTYATPRSRISIYIGFA